MSTSRRTSTRARFSALDVPDDAQPELLMLTLEQVADIALLPLPEEDALVELVARLRDSLGGDCATLYLLIGQDLVAEASIGFPHGDEPQGQHPRDRERIAFGVGLVGSVAAERRARLIPDLTPSRLSPRSGTRSLRSLVLAPLVVGGAVTGVVQVSAYQPHRFGPGDLTLLRLVADRVALAVEQLRGRERERLALEALRESEQRMAAVFESAADAILIVEENGCIETANPAAVRMFGARGATGLVGTPLASLLPDGAEAVRGQDVVAHRLDRSTFPVEVTVTTMDVPGRRLACAIVRDTTERTELARKLTFLSRHDTLTGLGNRALLEDRLGHALARMERHASGVGVLLCDLDHFKSVNDSMGHGAGDTLLMTIASRLREAVRPSDTVVRFGGDEFVIVCEDVPDLDSLARLGSRIVESVRRPLVLDGTEVFPTVSVGVAMSRSAGTSAEDLLGDADLALYAAKDAGRGRAVVFDERMRERARGRLRLRSELHRAIERGEIVVHYQPLFDLHHGKRRGGRVRGAEALIRWQHPTQGLLLPDAFLPLAVESDLIIDLDAYVTARACEDIAALGRRTGQRLDAWVNYSARTLADPDLCRRTSGACRESGLAPERLTVEVTENALLEDLATTGQALQALRHQQVHLAIDDFGAGHTALTYLTRLPVSAVKLDRSFTQAIDTSPVDRAVVRSVAELAGVLGMVTVAEGVETGSQLDLAAASGCRLGQGYLLARPGDYDTLVDLVSRSVVDLRLAGSGAGAR